MPEVKALVVDDSGVTRKIVRGLLGEAGIAQIEEAEDGVEAIRHLNNFHADVVVCDMNMLPLDGIEFTRLVRNSADSPNPYVPIIMLTGDASERNWDRAIKAGVHDFVAKPVTAKDLKERILAILENPAPFVREGRNLRPDIYAT